MYTCFRSREKDFCPVEALKKYVNLQTRTSLYNADLRFVGGQSNEWLKMTTGIKKINKILHTSFPPVEELKLLDIAEADLLT